jgi:hypothetical protein
MVTDDVPSDYSLRIATLEDAPEMAEFVKDVNIAEIGTPLDERRRDP